MGGFKNKKPNIGPITECQICSARNLKTILSLGHQARVHGHLTPKTNNEPETKYPLDLNYCPKCHLIQLGYAIDPKVVFFPDYPYHSGTTNMLVKNFRSLAEMTVKKYDLNSKDLVIDIGSNDGTLLQGFKEKGVRVLGIEPTNVAKFARRAGIPTIQEFFSEKVAKKIARRYGRAKIIAAANVFAHINHLRDFMRGVSALLEKDGVFITESQYITDIIKKLEVDTIYDEHLRYYTLKPMQKLFSLSGFSLVDAERISAAGGSIRVYAMKGEKQASSRVNKIIAQEKRAGVYNFKTLQKFGQKTVQAKYGLLELLIKCKKEGARIAGLGAPGRSNTLLGFNKIDHHILDYLCEKNTSPKIGLFAPGTHLPIVDEKKLIEEQPEYALVLSWHIGKELMKKTRLAGYKGKFIMPLPKPRIVKTI